MAPREISGAGLNPIKGKYNHINGRSLSWVALKWFNYTTVCLLLPLFLLGCSKEVVDANGQTQGQPSASAPLFPFPPVVVETPAQKEILGIEKRATDLLANRNYDGLDALAKEFRDSKECHATGYWKLSYVYRGLAGPSGAADAEWTNHFAILRDWIRAKPASITARCAMADALVGFAWKARGTDYSDKVPDQQWDPFFQRLNEAVSVLEEAGTLKEKCPCWYSVMLQAELGLQV